MKEDLQRLALHIFSMCLLNCITLEVEWIPRSANDRADFLSRVVDYDDWQVKRDYFLLAKEKWGPHSVDRFANHENTQLPRFNSRFWCPGTEAVDAFSVSGPGRERIIGSFHLFFSSPGSSITWLPLAVMLYFLFLLGLPLHFGH